MRRLGRSMLNGLTMLSLLLCVATCVLWVRSYWVSDVVTIRGKSGRVYRAELPRSGFQFVREGNAPPNEESGWEASYPRDPLPARRWLGFGAVRATVPIFDTNRQDARVVELTVLMVPTWSAALLFILMPTVALYRRVRGRRPAGRCHRCSYDLTGNASGVCPECGTKVEVIT